MALWWCVQVKTWKPQGDISQQMQEYFIGGALQLRDISLAGRPPDLKVRAWHLRKCALVCVVRGVACRHDACVGVVVTETV